MAEEITHKGSFDAGASPLATMTSALSVTNVDPVKIQDTTPPTMQGLNPGMAAATDRDSSNIPFPSPPDNRSPAPPSGDKPPPPSGDKPPLPSSDNGPPPPPPLINEPPPATDSPYVNVSTPRSNTKRRVIESYEYINNKRVVSPSSSAHSLTGPGYGIVGNTQTLTSGEGYAYVSNREVPFLDKGGRGEECPQCLQYQQQLDQWQRNSVGLASSYSKILAQLNAAQTILMRLEDTIKDELTARSPPLPPSSSSPILQTSPELELPSSTTPRVTKRTHTVMGRGSTGSLNSSNNGNSSASTPVPDKTVVTDMYPETEDHYPLSPHCHLQLAGLASHLARAIDICQSSAAALFKRGRLAPPRHRPTNATVHSSSPSSPRSKRQLVRLSTQPAFSLEGQVPSKPHLTSYTSNLASVEESSPTVESTEGGGGGGGSSPHSSSNMGAVGKDRSYGDVSGLHFGSVPSVEGPVDVEMDPGEKVRSRAERHGEGDRGETSTDKLKDRSVDKDGGDKVPSSVQSWQAGEPVMVPVNLDKQPNAKQQQQQPLSTKPYMSHMMSLMMEDQGFCIVDYPSEDKDTRDAGEATQTPDAVMNDKDFKQAMSKIADMEEERRNLLEEIETLQQDNQQVRFSLSEVLNALENKELQLILVMQDLTIATHEVRKAAEMRAELQKLKFDRDQILENFRTLEDDHAAVKYSLLQQLQQRPNNRAEASPDFLAHIREGGSSSEIEDKDTVYKQGFLVKQGGLVKSWKRRLFVLDCEGLSYYKTEQPVQVLTLSKISKVEHARDNAQHKFDVYTSDRVFRLMAPSHKEMQSWVGILQTLKDHRHAIAMAKHDGRPRTHIGVIQPVKALSLDSHDLDRNAVPLKATTLPTTTTTTSNNNNSNGAISREIPFSLQHTSVRSFQQLKAEEEEEGEGEEDIPVHTTMSFSLPASNHLEDGHSPSDLTAGGRFFVSSGKHL